MLVASLGVYTAQIEVFVLYMLNIYVSSFFLAGNLNQVNTVVIAQLTRAEHTVNSALGESVGKLLADKT